jgi:predicted nuclease with TOPRIM domain
VALNLKRSFEAFKNERELLATKHKLRDRQRAAADAARARLDAVRAEKARLEDMVASLRVQKAQVDAMAAASPNVQLDDSALGEAKQVLAEIKNRLDVTQKMLEDDMVFAAGPSEPPVQADLVLAEIQEFMAGNTNPR